jgi:hypothetical protein
VDKVRKVKEEGKGILIKQSLQFFLWVELKERKKAASWPPYLQVFHGFSYPWLAAVCKY